MQRNDNYSSVLCIHYILLLCLRNIKCNHVNYAEIIIFVISNNEQRTCAHVEEPTGAHILRQLEHNYDETAQSWMAEISVSPLS